MIIFFEDKDLVSFGNFLLERVAECNGDELADRLDGVTREDLENWAFVEQNKEENEG
jgi:hypothetical protein